MSNKARAGVIALAVVVVTVAFVALRPSDSSKKADDPAKTVKTEAGGGARQPTAMVPSAPAPPQEITLKGGVPVGGIKRIEVRKGDVVRLQVLTDEQGDRLHLHRYDIEKEAKAAKPANFRFKAGVEGVFEIESHTAEDAGGESLIARLVVAPS